MVLGTCVPFPAVVVCAFVDKTPHRLLYSCQIFCSSELSPFTPGGPSPLGYGKAPVLTFQLQSWSAPAEPSSARLSCVALSAGALLFRASLLPLPGVLPPNLDPTSDTTCKTGPRSAGGNVGYLSNKTSPCDIPPSFPSSQTQNELFLQRPGGKFTKACMHENGCVSVLLQSFRFIQKHPL